MQFTADGAYYVEALGVRQWTSRLFMCPWCGAHRDGPCTWHDFSLEAPWLATCRDHSRFQRDMAASKACGFQANHAAFAYYARILDAPYFQWTMVKLDWMHDVDLGILSYALGEI